MYYYAMNKFTYNKKQKQLFNAFLQLQNEVEVANFCRDLMTESEIEEFAGRLDVAIKLSEGKPQRQTSKETGVSIATVTRVNQWLKRGMNGYSNVISKLNHQHSSKMLASDG